MWNEMWGVFGDQCVIFMDFYFVCFIIDNLVIDECVVIVKLR